MRVLVIGKYPPIQGGVSTSVYHTAHELARRGHEVHVVTNANEVGAGFKSLFWGADETKLEGRYDTGSVSVHCPTPLATQSYVPWSPPFSSQLLGSSLAVMDRYHCELILSVYFEPYGIVGAMVSQITSKPVLLRHAGSDIGRLSKNGELGRSYRWMVSRAAQVLTGRGSGETRRALMALGANVRKLKSLGGSALPGYFFERRSGFDLGDLLGSLGPWYDTLPLLERERQEIRSINAEPIGQGALVIGAYGKVGRTKGSFALLDALDLLARKGRDFVFLSVAGGTTRTLGDYYRAIASRPDLARRTRLLPFLAPWRVPGFLQLCQVGCFLEHGFPITFHMPRVPRELLAAGTCMVCSREIVQKQPFRANLVDGKNYVLVNDPGATVDLAARLDQLIRDPALAHSIGRHGHFLSRVLESSAPSTDATADAVEEYARVAGAGVREQRA